MATSAVDKAIVVTVPAEVLGPGSPYEIRRLELRKEYGAVLASAKTIKVDSVESAEEATKHGRLLQVAVKETEEFFKGIKQQIDKLKKPILDAEKEDVGAYDEAKKNLATQLTAWDAEQRRIREEEERKAREEAEEAARLQREEEERILREQQLQRAIELESLGDTTAAEAVLEEKIELPPPMPVSVVAPLSAPVYIAGKVAKVRYTARLIDLKVLVKAIAEGRAPIGAISWNESYCNKRANDDKEAFDMPGVELVKTASTSFRA